MRERVVNIVRSMPFLLASGLFALYLLTGFFLVNPIAHTLLPWVGETRLASKLNAQQVQFNPFTLELTVKGLTLAEANGAPLASFDRLYLNLETTGLFRWAWRIQDIQLSQPRAIIALRPDGKLNWATLMAKLDEDKSPPSDTIVRVLIDRLKIENGNIEYTDAHRKGEPFRMVLSPLGVELDGLSSLPEDRGNYLIAAKLPEQGGTLKWKGEVGLNPVVSTGEVRLEGVRLERLIRVIKTASLPVKPTRGAIQASLGYHFAMVRDLPQAVLTKVQLRVDDLAATPAQGSGALAMKHFELALPRLDFSMQSGMQVSFSGLEIGMQDVRLSTGETVLFQLPRAHIQGIDFDLAKRRTRVGGVTLTAGEIQATRYLDGHFDWLDAWKPASAAASQAAPAAADRPFHFDVAAISLQDWRVRVLDRSFQHPASLELADLDLRLAVSNPDGAVRITGFSSEMASLSLKSAYQTAPAATLAGLRIEGGEFDLNAQTAKLQGVVLSGLRTELVRQADQPLNWQAMLAQARTAPPVSERMVARLATEVTQKNGWTLALQRLALEDAAVHVEDRVAKSAPVQLDIENGLLEAQDVTLDSSHAMPVRAAFTIRQGGTFEASGTLAAEPLKGNLSLKLAGLSLKPFAPYINRVARLKLNSGNLGASGKLRLKPGQPVALAFDGGFSLDQLAITEEAGDAPFLGWKNVSSSSVAFSLDPNRLTVKELVASNPFGKVIIFEDKTVNLQRVMRSSDTTLAAQGAPVKPAPSVKAAAPMFPVSIERLRIVEANVEFADLSLTPQFGTRMHTLSGVVAGLSTDPVAQAQVELDGKVDEFGSARVRGAIQPFQATEFTDMTLTFRNLEMANMTPYSGKFAGRKIDSGKLSVDLEYKIKQRQLAGENKFVIDTLKLGERIDSPDAMNLPLDLAIALLEDGDGRIDLDLPVSGSLDDPQFSYGKIVWKAIVNVLTSLVTAPFRALGSLLGISPDKLEAVEFDFGSASLLPPEQEKLRDVGLALAKRPQLKLSVAPTYETRGDTLALQTQQIRREVAQRMGLHVEPGQAPGPVDPANPHAQDVLEDLYAERFSQQGGVRVLKAGLESSKEAGKSKTAPAALHGEMLVRLTQQIPVAEADLLRLAHARGASVKQHLIKLGQVRPDRVSVGEPVSQEAGGKLAVSKLSLGVGTPAPVAPQTPPRPASVSP